MPTVISGTGMADGTITNGDSVHLAAASVIKRTGVVGIAFSGAFADFASIAGLVAIGGGSSMAFGAFLNGEDHPVVAQSVTVSATGAWDLGLLACGVKNRVNISGGVLGTDWGMLSAGAEARITLSATATVTGGAESLSCDLFSGAISITGNNSVVVNHGSIIGTVDLGTGVGTDRAKAAGPFVAP